MTLIIDEAVDVVGLLVIVGPSLTLPEADGAVGAEGTTVEGLDATPVEEVDVTRVEEVDRTTVEEVDVTMVKDTDVTTVEVDGDWPTVVAVE